MCKRLPCNVITMTIFIIMILLYLSFILSMWYPQVMPYVIFISRSFEIMFPVLAVGALVKYLAHDSNNCKK